MVTADYYYPDLGCLVDFLQSGVKKLLAWQESKPTTLDLRSQSFAIDHAMATPLTISLSNFIKILIVLAILSPKIKITVG